MDLDLREDVRARFERLLRESKTDYPPIFERTQKALEEGRRLLDQVARDHPDID